MAYKVTRHDQTPGPGKDSGFIRDAFVEVKLVDYDLIVPPED